MRNTIIFSMAIFILSALSVEAQKNQPIELGQVDWLRDYDTALKQSKKEGKPVLILFQEVPGCSTSQGYGKRLLSNGMIVDVIENEFVPLAVYNNVGGKDKAILDKYKEPTWNNPVVRIVNEKGADIVPRLSRDYSENGLVTTMVNALRKQEGGVPAYVNLLQQEYAHTSSTERYYKMYCFWTGEAHLGGKKGVVATEPGFMGGHEVVKVNYDESVVSQKELDKFAQKGNNTPIQKSKFRLDRDEQYYLKKSPYRFLPLSDIQRTKINHAISSRKDPTMYLSPTQKQWLQDILQQKRQNLPLIYMEDWSKAWWEMDSLLDKV